MTDPTGAVIAAVLAVCAPALFALWIDARAAARRRGCDRTIEPSGCDECDRRHALGLTPCEDH